MNILEMTDNEIYELAMKTLINKLGTAKAQWFIRQRQPGTGNYSVDRHQLLANLPDIDTLVKHIQEREVTREAEERARARRFEASQSEIQKMTDLEIYEIGSRILTRTLGVAGSMNFLRQCQELNGGYPLDRIENMEEAQENIKLYTASLRLNPKMVEGYIRRGNAYSYIGEHAKAIADYDKAIELKPEYAKAYYRRGVAYAKNAEYAKAIADYNAVIQRDPEHADARRSRAEARQCLKEQEKAEADLTVARALETNTVPSIGEALLQTWMRQAVLETNTAPSVQA